MKIIVGIIGVKTSGKSTASDMIKTKMESLGYSDIGISALADKLKDCCAKVFDLERSVFDDQRYKEVPLKLFHVSKILIYPTILKILTYFNLHDRYRELCNVYGNSNLLGMEFESPRHIAQIVGTEILRAAGDIDIHCKNMDLSHDVTIVSDIRFPSEFDYFSNLPDVKFIPLYLQRTIAEELIDMKTAHSSETSVFSFCDKCIKIENNLTKRDLKRHLDSAIEYILEKDKK